MASPILSHAQHLSAQYFRHSTVWTQREFREVFLNVRHKGSLGRVESLRKWPFPPFITEKWGQRKGRSKGGSQSKSATTFTRNFFYLRRDNFPLVSLLRRDFWSPLIDVFYNFTYFIILKLFNFVLEIVQMQLTQPLGHRCDLALRQISTSKSKSMEF